MNRINIVTKPLMWFMTLLLAAFVAGCGGGGGGSAVAITAPTVSYTVPGANATGIAINRKITATFSKDMAPATISATSFTLAASGAAAVTGTVAYNTASRTATFTPTSPATLVVSTVYTATISTAVTDVAGHAMAAAKTWSFTTGTTTDTTAPIVSSTVPLDAASGVARNTTVAAIFSEPMDPATINATNFTLAESGVVPAVTGAVALVGTNAVFTPTSNLAASAVYTATVTTAVTDLAGNPLAVAKTWSFTTGTTLAAGPAPVVLGTAGNFVILAKTGVSTTGTTAVVGDIGLSPAAASYITGFGLIADSTNTFSTSSLVTGKVYAADYAVPTPDKMTTAISDMQIAFTDAAGRTLPDHTELGAGNISGMTLAPGLYKWGTGVLITSAGVTLSGGPNDVWIFQVAQDLTVNNSALVTLSGGAQAKNIFWQVSGQATLGTAADFKGIILSQTLISLNTGAVMTGRALAQTAVTLNATAVTQP